MQKFTLVLLGFAIKEDDENIKIDWIVESTPKNYDLQIKARKKLESEKR